MGVLGFLSLSAYRTFTYCHELPFSKAFLSSKVWFLGLGLAFFGNVRRGLGKNQGRKRPWSSSMEIHLIKQLKAMLVRRDIF